MVGNEPSTCLIRCVLQHYVMQQMNCINFVTSAVNTGSVLGNSVVRIIFGTSPQMEAHVA